MHHWQPTISLERLQHRARLLEKIRIFFKNRQILEVDTPILSQSTVTDPYLQSFSTIYQVSKDSKTQKLYLQTSPEFLMKRLLAAGSGPIYQIAHAFRNDGERGRWHNPEFTLLEWYRPGFNLSQLMDETDDFLQTILECDPAIRLTYQQIFEEMIGIDPHQASLSTLIKIAKDQNIHLHNEKTLTNKDSWLQLILDNIMQQKAYSGRPIFIYDFPASQACLAQIRDGNPNVAERVEVYLQGIELANGFYELTDVVEQKKRFLKDVEQRKQQDLEFVPISESLLGALAQGLPVCSGIAFGIDRLIALCLHVKQLEEIMTFPIERA